ncbi:MAG: thioredoxin domain-containing protein [bacterium]
MENKFLKFIIWFVALAVILLAIFYFSISENREWFKSGNRLLQKQAEELKLDNQDVIDQANNQKIGPVRPIDQTDHIWGKMSAPVQLVVYSNFGCPFCADFYKTLKKVEEEFGKQIVIAFRHYLLDSYDKAMITSLAVECAAEQDEFLSMQEYLFAENNITVQQIIANAEELGLDKDKFKTCLIEEKYQDKILQQKLEAESFGVIGTPTSFLNNMILPGAYQFEDFEDQTGQQHLGLKSLIKRELP